MSAKEDVRQFLMSRRAAVTPGDVGLPNKGDDRRVPGLRREEVATLAGVSVEYYTRMEKGHIAGVSDSVLSAVASALRLNDVEREYLFDLARAASLPGRVAPAPEAEPGVRASVQRMLNAMAVPAIVQTASLDIVGANVLARAMYSVLFDKDAVPNFARFNYFDPRSRDFFVHWEWSRRTTAAILRLEAGRDPLNTRLTSLIAELAAGSPWFEDDWASSNVHEHRNGVKSFRHPEVGVLEVAFDVFDAPGSSGLKLVSYSAPAGTPTAEKFALLASWTAEPATESATRTDESTTR